MTEKFKDGTRISGFVTAEQNKPPRECWNCRWYSDDLCHHPLVMIDPEVKGENDKPKPVGEEDCCDNFQNKKHPLQGRMKVDEDEA